VTPPVAIAIVSWNTRELLDACLRSLREDADRGLAEVWVVDNGSTDGSPELVRERHPWARLLVPERNLGYGPAVNRVAERTDANWIAPSNADLEFEPGALRTLLDRGAAAPRVGVVGPRLILPDGSTQPAVQPFPSVSDALLRNLSVYRLHRRIGERLCLDGYWDAARPARVDWVTGAFLLVRREAWDAIGGFDEAQWMYAEDIDLCWRAHRHGWEVRYEPEARVHHHLSVSAEQAFGDAERRAARMSRANYEWIARRQGPAAAWAVATTSVATLRLRTAVLDALATAQPERFARSRDNSRRLLRQQQAGAQVLRGA
jgi:N-acetylglucosaminyl-diphospho-decaprenol L-rhamnosyltransferase